MVQSNATAILRLTAGVAVIAGCSAQPGSQNIVSNDAPGQLSPRYQLFGVTVSTTLTPKPTPTPAAKVTLTPTPLPTPTPVRTPYYNTGCYQSTNVDPPPTDLGCYGWGFRNAGESNQIDLRVARDGRGMIFLVNRGNVALNVVGKYADSGNIVYQKIVPAGARGDAIIVNRAGLFNISVSAPLAPRPISTPQPISYGIYTNRVSGLKSLSFAPFTIEPGTYVYVTNYDTISHNVMLRDNTGWGLDSGTVGPRQTITLYTKGLNQPMTADVVYY